MLEFLNQKLIEQYGEEKQEQIQKGYETSRSVTLRINTIKTTKKEILEELNKANIKYQEVEWYENALILPESKETEIRKLQIYENGEIYLQSLSSMIPALILEPKPEENILDMAAAPGGKTTQMSAISNNMALITACEKNKIRLDRLKYNIEKQGAKRINVLQQDSRKLDSFFSFDKILLDAPCSGSGTLHLPDENIDKIFNEELVKRSIKTQQELLKKAITILKPKHEMIYSTCSILKEENENQLKQLLQSKKIEIVPIEDKWFENIPQLPTTVPGTMCIMPNELFEGFFVAKIRKM